MKYRISELDNRFAHRDRYRWLVEFHGFSAGTGVLDFDRSRRWFVDHYGWSQEVELQKRMLDLATAFPQIYNGLDINPVWAFSVKYRDYRIYVASDKELSWFLLCHPKSS